MKKIIIALVENECRLIVKGSTRGCVHSYTMTGRTPSGQSLSIETNPTSQSNLTCSLPGQTSRIYRMALRKRGYMSLFADAWDNSVCSGDNLEKEFARLKAIAANKEQDHGH